MKTFLKAILFLLLLSLAALTGYFFFGSGGERKQVQQFVSTDFFYAIESNQPVKDWRGISNSEVWKQLKGHPFFAETATSANYLDSLLNDNKLLVKFISLGDLWIVAYPQGSDDYEFSFLVDLKGSSLQKFQPLFVELLKELDYKVKVESYFNYSVYSLYDPEDGSTLYLSPVNNILVLSYSEALLQKSIDQSEKPGILEDPDFTEVYQQTDRDMLYSVYLNFRQFHGLAAVFLDEPGENVLQLSRELSYGGFDLGMGDDQVVLNGYLRQVDSVPSYFSAFRKQKPGLIGAQRILPENTAMFTSIGAADFGQLYERFMAQYREESPAEYEDIQKNQRKIEKLLKINFEEDFFSWMTEEVVAAAIPSGDANAVSYYALLHFDDFDHMKERMDYVLKRIGKTPLKFDKVDYRGYSIRYLKLKGFFTLFFKKVFNRIEKPHFVYIDDYVVFSNDVPSLERIIDAYLDNRVLEQDKEFMDFLDQFDRRSSIFNYINSQHFSPVVRANLEPELRRQWRIHEPYFLDFPRIGLQISPDGSVYSAYLLMQYQGETRLREPR